MRDNAACYNDSNYIGLTSTRLVMNTKGRNCQRYECDILNTNCQRCGCENINTQKNVRMQTQAVHAMSVIFYVQTVNAISVKC